MFNFDNKITFYIEFKLQKCIFIPILQKKYNELPDSIEGDVIYPEEGTYNPEGWFRPITINKKEIMINN